MSERGECRLCGDESRLLRSHVTPQFVARYIKRTSAMSHPRLVTAEGRRVQDSHRARMFCGGCEGILSTDERLFSDALFREENFLRPEVERTRYGPWFLRFVCGLGLRAGMAALDDPEVEWDDEVVALVDTACDAFRSYLLDRAKWPGSLRPQFVRVGMDVVPTSAEEELTAWSWYMARGADHTVTVGATVAIYIHIPHWIFWIPLSPPDVAGWETTGLRRRGFVGGVAPQRIDDGPFWGFIVDRVEGMVQRTGYRQLSDGPMLQAARGWAGGSRGHHRRVRSRLRP